MVSVMIQDLAYLEDTWTGDHYSDDEGSQKMVNAKNVLVVMWDHDDDSDKNDGLVHADDALECSVAYVNANDGVDSRVLNDTQSLYPTVAMCAAGHYPHDASLIASLEIHEERARERTWVMFDQSWSLPY